MPSRISNDLPDQITDADQTAYMAPRNVGIKAIEIYTPNTCVDQAELEENDGVSKGKYVIGLGQTSMSFCNDREDIYSITLSAVSSLMRKYSIDPRDIGRLEVGTETLLDKSKSVKSVLMQLFSATNTNIEGVDTINACYGGTNALFNAVNWVESSSWDGRNAIVVTGDIAVYSSGPARPTGGAGAVAMLIGPNAPIVFQPGIRGSYMDHVYDFFKPDLVSEYPVVDGFYSLECYTRAVDECYKAYKSREKVVSRRKHTQASKNGTHDLNGQDLKDKVAGSNGNFATSTSERESERQITDRFDYMCFHSPTSKLVSKSFARLMYNDYLASPTHPRFKDVDSSVLEINNKDSFVDRRIEKAFLSNSAEDFQRCVQPSMTCANLCGNMYTASVYSGITSLIDSVEPSDLLGKAVGIFSYGSGLASTMYALKVVGDTTQMRSALNLTQRLKTRKVKSPESYEDAMALRENIYLSKDAQPTGSIEDMTKGAYYLTGIDGWKRSYQVVE